MGNPATLQPNVFSKQNQPVKKGGRVKGIPNRSTVYKRILDTKMKIKLPDGTQKTMTLYEAVALGQVQSAMKGNTNAWKEIQDSIHGKLTDKSEVEHGGSIQQKIIVEVVNGSKSIDNTNQD